MTVEDLLQPRYKVIADWPFNKEVIGKILFIGDYIGGMILTEERFLKYPHLFKNLEWWEERKKEDMPEYVKWDNEPEIYKVLDWEINEVYVSAMLGEDSFFTMCRNAIPATKEEYENQKTNQ